MSSARSAGAAAPTGWRYRWPATAWCCRCSPGCLALTLLAGTLLTVFSSDQMTAPSLGKPGHQLPDAIVLVGGTEAPLSSLNGSVLALVPPQLQLRAPAPARARGGHRRGAALHRRDARRPRSPAWPSRPALGASHAVEDTEGALGSTYHPATLTAVLVNANGSVAKIARDRGKGFQLTGAMRSLVPAAKEPQPGRHRMASVVASPAGS